MQTVLPAYGNFRPVFGGVSRMSLDEVAALIRQETATVSAEGWTAEERALWNRATLAQRRAALRLRWRLRANSDPRSLPRPACPVAALLRVHELAYRDTSACIGGESD